MTEISKDSTKANVVSAASAELGELLGGWNALSVNPTNNDLFASSSSNLIRKPADSADSNLDIGSIQMWKLSEEALSSMGHSIGNKR